MVRPRAVPVDGGGVLRAVFPAEKLGEVSDTELVARIQTGDRWAEEATFRKYVDYIAALSFRLLRDQAEADDVVQDTFVDAFAQLRAAGVPQSLRQWLAGIAVHKVHRRFRRRRLLTLIGRRHTPEEQVLATTGRQGTSPELLTELALVDAALSVLTDVDRASWVLRYVDGYGLEEIAELCGCSLATAKRRIRRAHDVVQSHVTFQGGESDD